MLDKLRQLHLEIIQNLDAIKDITALPEPDVGRLVATRLALTRASRARTLLLESSYDDLIARSSGTIKAAIGTLLPTCIDHDPRAHLRRPIVMMRQG